MKCPKCDGTGKMEIGVGAFTIHGADCDQCDGTGIVEPQTNDEWRRTCSTKEFAEWLHDITGYEGICSVCDDCTVSKHEECRYNDGVDGWVKWLKENHG